LKINRDSIPQKKLEMVNKKPRVTTTTKRKIMLLKLKYDKTHSVYYKITMFDVLRTLVVGLVVYSFPIGYVSC